MKKIFLLFLFLTSCSSSQYKQDVLELTEHPAIVIKKDSIYGKFGYSYSVKVFDGEYVNKYIVAKKDYDKLSKGDTLKNYILK